MKPNLPEGVQPIGKILTEVIARRGLARLRQRQLWEQVWQEVVGPEVSEQTRIGSYRRGVLEILVNNSSLLQELAAFRKETLIEELRKRLSATAIRDVKFRLDQALD